MDLKWVFYDWYGWNRSLFETLNSGLPEAAQPLAHLGSALGSYWAAPFMLAALLLWAKHSQAPLASSPASVVGQAHRFALACLLALVVTSLLKWGLDLPRPATVIASGVRVLAPVESTHGFPSGHSVYTALVLGTLWPLVSRRIQAALVVALLWVGYSRIAMGAHFPADVLAGWLVGAGCFIAAAAALACRRNISAPVVRFGSSPETSKKR